MRYARLLVILGGILLQVSAVQAKNKPSDQVAYFPLAVGNTWTYSVYVSLLDSVVRTETIQVDDMIREQGTSYYHLTMQWPPFGSAWVRANANGDLYWCGYPGQQEYPMLLFSDESDEGWLSHSGYCIDSVAKTSCPSISAVQSASDDVFCFVGAWRPGDCYDAYWWGSVEAGIGPIAWRLIGVGGAYLEWSLVDFRPGRQTCDCKCHADPLCDGALDALDLGIAIDVAFGGKQPPTDHGCWCYAHFMNGQTDVDCSGTTDLVDISKIIDVIFGGADPAKVFCDPSSL